MTYTTSRVVLHDTHNRIESGRMTWLEYNEALQELRGNGEIVVGTGAQATWRLRRADLMPRHFVVSTADDRATICPFSSEAVVAVNGRQLPVGATELHDGDVIDAGSGEFRFWATTPGESRSQGRAPVAGRLVNALRRSALSLQRVSTGIGSDESNDLVIDGGEAASFHAEVRREAGGHVLRAPESATVKLNGRRVTSAVLLSEGDELEIADVRLRYTREPLTDGISDTTTDRITSEAGVSAQPVVSSAPRNAVQGDLSSALTLRAPMRAVAFVSSVIAAVAIATLLFLHRGP
jgi:predicted component of type VI protein secretion system